MFYRINHRRFSKPLMSATIIASLCLAATGLIDALHNTATTRTCGAGDGTSKRFAIFFFAVKTAFSITVAIVYLAAMRVLRLHQLRRERDLIGARVQQSLRRTASNVSQTRDEANFARGATTLISVQLAVDCCNGLTANFELLLWYGLVDHLAFVWVAHVCHGLTVFGYLLNPFILLRSNHRLSTATVDMCC